MAISSEKASYNLFDMKTPSERFVSKIPKRNNTTINDPKNHYNRIRSEIAKKTSTPTRNYNQLTAQQGEETIHLNDFKSQIHGKTSQKTWAVQPTEQTGPTRNTYTIGKHNVKQRYIGQSKKNNTKSQTKMQRMSLKEGNLPTNCNDSDNEPLFDTSQEGLMRQAPYSTRKESINNDLPFDMSRNVPIVDLPVKSRGNRQIFRLNSETVREIEALGDKDINYSNIKYGIKKQPHIDSEKVFSSTNPPSSVDTKEECEVSTLLFARTEELLRSSKKTRKSKRDSRERK